MKTTSTSLLHRLVLLFTGLSLYMINATVNADDNVLATGTLSASASVEETTGNIDIDIVQGKVWDGTIKGSKSAKSDKGAKSDINGKKSNKGKHHHSKADDYHWWD